MVNVSYQICFCVFILLITNSALSDNEITEKSRIIQGTPCSQMKVVTDYFVRLIYWEKNNHEYFCTGTLLNPLFVITAHHCFSNAKMVNVYIFWRSSRQIIIRVAKFFPLLDDLGLMKLEQSVPSNIGMTYPRIPKKALSIDISQDCPEVLIAGYGKTDPDNAYSDATTLMCVYLPAQSWINPGWGYNRKCMEYIKPDLDYSGKPDNYFCSFPKDGKSACYGDSGGPAVCVKTGELIGVTSSVTHECKNGISVFIRIDQQLFNINSIMFKSSGNRIKFEIFHVGFIWFLNLLYVYVLYV